jgi:hypothetical protein
VPGHEGIAGNETAHLHARTGCEHCSQDLNQPVASQSELQESDQGLDKQKSHKTMGIYNWTQTGKGTYNRTLCQKNKASVEIKQ